MSGFPGRDLTAKVVIERKHSSASAPVARRDWFKEAADREFQQVEDEIAAREIARQNAEAMLVKPLVYNESEYPRIASIEEPRENQR